MEVQKTSIDISLILPAFNEAATISQTIREAISFFAANNCTYELIVAADGDDGTRENVRDLALANASIKVIGGPARRGKGRGIREAVSIATGNIIGFADADNKVPIEEFSNLRPWFDREFDIVIGSRALADAKIERRQPWYRQIGAKGFAVFMHTIVGLPEIRDTQCGFKFFRGDVARDLFRRQRIDGYMFDVEVLAIAERLNYGIKEVSVRWRDDADSRLNIVSGNLRNALDIFKIRLSLRKLAGSGFAAIHSLRAEAAMEPGAER